MISMKFALVNGTEETPSPKKSGLCPFCNAKVISKCGTKKSWHWAHKGKIECDPWWENETEWHRAWKNNFPEHCQERIHHDEKGERHIADVMTDEGWVIEFQHSFIKPEERSSRNSFYKKLAWVVDGTRRKRDKTQFFKLIEEDIQISSTPKIYRVYLDDSALLKDWSNSFHPVFFDFGEENLWCLIPSSEGSWGAVMEVPCSLFISMHNRNGCIEEDFDGFVNALKVIVSNHKRRRQDHTQSAHLIFPYRYYIYRQKRRFSRRL